MFQIFVFYFISCAYAMPNLENSNPTVSTGNVLKKDCAMGILSTNCLKIGVISLLTKLNSKDEVSLFPGISLVKEDSESQKAEVVAELARSLSSEPEEKLDKFLLYNVGTFLDTHSVKLRLLDDAAIEEARSMVGEGRGKNPLSMGGKKGGMGGLMAMAMMMKGTLMTLGLGALALLAGKALMTAMMSLLLSAIIGIKSLSSGHKSTTYEIVSKPIYSHSHSHSTAHEDVGGYGHSGYGRSLNPSRR
ncbi:uncharacterized protein LOC131845512 isoform X2 [Achroia grisella]|uniref:uncharacterized protein LOC131845512 isoform X2 n=1 Tax=Achroia grisella TaxID=688607 RepID=UPI0027D240A0|nr:uncharacterized protein LOC131845512 isoform X2 [Achroia grisella]